MQGPVGFGIINEFYRQYLLNPNKQIIRKKVSREIILKHKPLIKNYFYFMTHGYQFENWLSLHIFLAPIWKSFIEDDNERVILNELWYELKQENKNITEENIESVASNKDIDISEFSSKKINHDLSKIDKNLKYNGRNIKNEAYHEEIIQFMASERYKPITHVIFGHSHESDISLKNNLTIGNPGCWVEGKQPSYIEIYIDGDFGFKEF